MAETYEFDDLIRLRASFKNVDGVLTDPTVVTLRVTKPGMDPIIYTFGTDEELIKDSAGVYRLDWLCSVVGEHKYRWKGTGVVQIGARGGFFVNPE